MDPIVPILEGAKASQTAELIFGGVIVVVVVVLLLTITFLAQRTIEKIASSGYGTARQTIKDLTNGK